MINTREIAAEYRLSHWSSIIQERNASGKSIKSYCESIGIRTNVYFYWQRKLREAACQELLPAIISDKEKAIIPSGWAVCDVNLEPTSISSISAPTADIVIEIGKSRVTADADTNLDLLGNICRMLMSLC